MGPIPFLQSSYPPAADLERSTPDRTSEAMARVKKQHYVPQFLLRKFASASAKKAKLWALDKRTKALRLSSVRNVAHENQFYEYVDDDGSRLELEELMSGIDAIGAGIVAKILDRHSLMLSMKDRIWLSYFVACQMSRTPMTRGDMENLRKMIVHKWGPDICAEGDDRPIGDYGPEDAKRSSLVHIQVVPEFAKILQKKVWTLSEAPPGRDFIIGDNPVTRHNMLDRWPRGNLGLNNKGIELYMPLSPRLSVHVICPALAEAACLTPDISDEYLSAIKNGTPVKLKPENVEFANSLQVIWAERFVFGRHQSDLEMPLEMLRTNPELRDGPGVRQRPEDA